MICNGDDFDPTSQGMAKPDEPRSHLRCDVKASGVAVVFRGCAASAALNDLSLGGMAVQYTPASPGLPAAGVCDLISSKADVDLPRGIQCCVVYDIAALAEGLSFSGEAIRRRGFRFLGLAAGQKRQIRALFEGTPVGIDGRSCLE
jgi:hypothetical protein